MNRVTTLGEHATALAFLVAYGRHAHDLYADVATRVAVEVIRRHPQEPYDDRCTLARLESFDGLVAQAKRRAS